MRYEHIITREDKSKVRIDINLLFNSPRYGEHEWKYTIVIKPFRKRKWTNIPADIPDYQFRKMEWDEKAEYWKKRALDFVSKEELHQAQILAWESIKPTK